MDKYFMQWLEELFEITSKFGYSRDFVLLFMGDIVDCYDKGMSVEECFEELF